jgi:hypothetical protein
VLSPECRRCALSAAQLGLDAPDAAFGSAVWAAPTSPRNWARAAGRVSAGLHPLRQQGCCIRLAADSLVVARKDASPLPAAAVPPLADPALRVLPEDVLIGPAGIMHGGRPVRAPAG